VFSKRSYIGKEKKEEDVSKQILKGVLTLAAMGL